MFIKKFMTKNPVVVTPETLVTETVNIMKQHNLKRLPVIANEKLVGLVTETDLMKALPSPATALSKYEINYLTSKITVADTMTKDIITANPDDTVESAVMIMREHDIGCLPILENEKLVGIITESNIFDALTELLGLKHSGIRVTITVSDRIGVLADLTNLIRNLNITIISLATFHMSDNTAAIIMRLATDDSELIRNSLTEHNYDILHISSI